MLLTAIYSTDPQTVTADLDQYGVYRNFVALIRNEALQQAAKQMAAPREKRKPRSKRRKRPKRSHANF